MNSKIILKTKATSQDVESIGISHGLLLTNHAADMASFINICYIFWLLILCVISIAFYYVILLYGKIFNIHLNWYFLWIPVATIVMYLGICITVHDEKMILEKEDKCYLFKKLLWIIPALVFLALCTLKLQHLAALESVKWFIIGIPLYASLFLYIGDGDEPMLSLPMDFLLNVFEQLGLVVLSAAVLSAMDGKPLLKYLYLALAIGAVYLFRPICHCIAGRCTSPEDKSPSHTSGIKTRQTQRIQRASQFSDVNNSSRDKATSSKLSFSKKLDALQKNLDDLEPSNVKQASIAGYYSAFCFFCKNLGFIGQLICASYAFLHLETVVDNYTAQKTIFGIHAAFFVLMSFGALSIHHMVLKRDDSYHEILLTD